MSDSTHFDGSRLPRELNARIRSELDDGEQLLWAGQPRPNRFSRMNLSAVLTGVPWMALVIFGMAAVSWMAAFRRAPAMPNAGGGIGGLLAGFPVWGLPLILIGLGALGSPLLLRRRAKRTCYALTNRRAILWEAGTFGSIEVRSYRPAALKNIYRRDYGDGSGDLVFEESMSERRTRNQGAHQTTQSHGFLGIDNVRKVEQLLRKTLFEKSSS